jgi:hypothetical protein
MAAKSQDALPVIRWLLLGKGGLIIGGKLSKELLRTNFRDTMVVLDRAGRLHRQDDAKIEGLAARFQADCKSNDSHVLATAAVSGCRLVFTRDKVLQQDLKDKKILDPIASIYSSAGHKHLLTTCECG